MTFGEGQVIKRILEHLGVTTIVLSAHGPAGLQTIRFLSRRSIAPRWNPSTWARRMIPAPIRGAGPAPSRHFSSTCQKRVGKCFS